MIDLDELQRRTTRQIVLGGHGLDVVNMHGSDFDALIAELSALRVRVAELERLSTELHLVALSIAARNALPDLIAELRMLRARVAELERDARLGAVVREVAATGGVAVAGAVAGVVVVADDRSMFGATIITAIADALRAEEGGEHG